MSNRFNITCAHPGFCTMCHTEIADFEGFVKFGDVMRPNVIRLKSNFRQGLVELSDGTYMTVSLCDKCINFKPEDCAKIYESEYRGWQKEVDSCTWKEESKPLVKHWMSRQAKVEIKDRKDVVWTKNEKQRISKPKIEALEEKDGAGN